MADLRQERIKELFQEAAKREPSQRSAYLAEQCRDDTPLRSAVESLLVASEEASGFLDGSPVLSIEGSGLRGSNLQPGQALSHYRLVEKIGEGGMGVVWEALDIKLKRHVALKVLPSDLIEDPRRRSRFLREAQAAASLNHPNIATVHEVDEAEGVVFIVMELVRGRTMRSILKASPLPIREAVRLGMNIAEGLAEAHHAGIIHRDLKPENVIIGSNEGPKILDFGLAKRFPKRADRRSQLSEAETLSEEMTREGELLGTVTYMSPEQARGEVVDARSDIFSFGIMLFEMVTGSTPFRGPSTVDTLSSIIRDEAFPAASLNPRVPAELERILTKCLEKRQAERYQHTDDLLVDLRRLYRDIESGTSKAPPRRRQRRLVRAGAAAGALLVAIVAGWLMLEERRSEPRIPQSTDARKTSAVSRMLAQADVASIAVLPFTSMSGDPDNEYFADGLSEELINALAKVPGLRVIARTSSFQFKGKNEDVRVIGQKLNVGVILEGSVRKSQDRFRITAQLLNAADGFHLWSETYDRKQGDIFAVQDEITRAVVGALKIKLLPSEGTSRKTATSNLEAYDAYLRGWSLVVRNDAADLQASIREFERATALDPGFALAWAGLGMAYGLQADLPEVAVEQQLQRVHEGRRKAREALGHALSLDEGLPEARAIGAILQVPEDWDFVRADEETQRALSQAPGRVEVVFAAAYLAFVWGRFEEQYALSARLNRLDPLNNIYKAYLGLALFCLGRWDEAEPTLKEIARLDPALELPHELLGDFLLQRGRPGEALAEARWLTFPSKRLKVEAAAYHALGRKQESDRALSDLIENYAPVGAYLIAQVYAYRREADRAFEWLERARDQQDSGLMLLKVDTVFETFHEDARYAALLRKLHLAS